MSRRTLTFTASAPDRDSGKVFVLQEFPASRAERWAVRALLALGKASIEIPDAALAGGMESIAELGYAAIARIPAEEAQPLLDEMMECVQIMPNPSDPRVVRRLIEDDIEEVTTRMKLRLEVFKLHTGFSFAAAPSTSESGPAAQFPSSKA